MASKSGSGRNKAKQQPIINTRKRKAINLKEFLDGLAVKSAAKRTGKETKSIVDTDEQLASKPTARNLRHARRLSPSMNNRPASQLPSGHKRKLSLLILMNNLPANPLPNEHKRRLSHTCNSVHRCQFHPRQFHPRKLHPRVCDRVVMAMMKKHGCLFVLACPFPTWYGFSSMC